MRSKRDDKEWPARKKGVEVNQGLEGGGIGSLTKSA